MRSAGGTASPVSHFTPAAVSLSGWAYDGITGCFRQRFTAWADVADAKTNVPSLYSTVNPSSITSAAITSGRLEGVFTGTGTYFGGTSTAGHFKRTTAFNAQRVRYERVFRIDFVNSVDTTFAFWNLTSNASGRIGCGVDLFRSGGSYSARYLVNDSTFGTLSALAAGENTAGVWFRVTVGDGLYLFEYNKSLGGTTAPTEIQWTHGIAVAIGANTTGGIYAGRSCVELFGANVQNGTNAAGFIFAQERVSEPSTGATKPYVPTGTGGYATSAQDFVLYDDVYIGGMTDATLQSALESRLPTMTNTLSGDASTWTFKIERSAVVSTYSGGSFTGLGSLDASGSGPWVRVTARSTASSSAAGGSLDLRRASFSVPV